jgi:arylsulfatase A-like enzyme
LFILTDDQRADTIRALGNLVIETPHLDSLVREGTVFTRALSPNPICVASRAEILSGCCGMRNGRLLFNGQFTPDQMLWPEAMRRAGYRTWYVGKWHTSGRPTTRGYDESLGLFAGGGRAEAGALDHAGRKVTGYVGWVFQNDDGRLFPEQGIGLTPDISTRLADAAIEFLKRKSQQPFFLHVNFTAPHDPLLIPPGYQGKYDPNRMPLPPNFLPRHPFDHGNFSGRDEQLFAWPRTPEEVRREIAAYYAVISHMDEQIGRILAALRSTGQAERTIVIFTSDQGIALGSHGLRGKQNMYEHTVAAPLIVRGPGIPKSVRRSTQCYLRDLYPTVCDLAGIEIPKSVQGRSLLGVVRGQAETLYPEVFGYFTDVQRMIRTDRWKLIYYPQIGRRQLFDVIADPQEQHDLSEAAPHVAVRDGLCSKLAAWQDDVKDPAPRAASK